MIQLGEQETLRKNPRIWILLLAFFAMQGGGVYHHQDPKTEVKKEEMRPQLESSEESLLASYNKQVRAVQSLQATVDLIPSTGTTYSGVIEEYHDVPGIHPGAAPGDGARDRPGSRRRQEHFRHGGGREGIPDLYSLEELILGGPDGPDPAIEKAAGKSAPSAYRRSVVLAGIAAHRKCALRAV